MGQRAHRWEKHGQVLQSLSTHRFGHVVFLRVRPGEEAVGAQQLPAERPDFVSVDHPPQETLRHDRQSLAPGAQERSVSPHDSPDRCFMFRQQRPQS